MGSQHHPIDSGTEHPSQLIADVRDVQYLLDQLEACLREMLPEKRTAKPVPKEWREIALWLQALSRRILR